MPEIQVGFTERRISKQQRDNSAHDKQYAAIFTFKKSLEQLGYLHFKYLLSKMGIHPKKFNPLVESPNKYLNEILKSCRIVQNVFVY